jgi:hypothetical protein
VTRAASGRVRRRAFGPFRSAAHGRNIEPVGGEGRGAMIQVQRRYGATLIEACGVLGVDDVTVIDTIIGSADQLETPTIVIDLDACTIVGQGVFQDLMIVVDDAVRDGAQVVFACARLSGRQLLNRARTSSAGVFASVGDALQLQRYAALGYVDTVPPDAVRAHG